MKLEIGSVWLLDRLTFLSILRMSQTVQTRRLGFIYVSNVVTLHAATISLLLREPQMPLEMGTMEMNTTSAMEGINYSFVL